MSTGYQYQQGGQYQQPAYQYQQPGQPSKPPEKSFKEKYLYWMDPAIVFYIFIMFVFIIAAIVTVGIEISSVPHASAQWSYNSTV